jgi:transcriptional regulator with XRE-family HTH domain
MKTVGQIIKDARDKKRLSLLKVEHGTKIKKEFIEALEKGDWEHLPEFPVVLGFVKNLSNYLGISEKQCAAVLKRDYPPKILNVNPKPDVTERFSWSPKLTFLLGVCAILIVVAGYLLFQYKKFVSPPTLSVLGPKEGEVVRNPELAVFGKTDPDATVKINNQPFLVDEDGNFNGKVSIYEGTDSVNIEAVSRSGRKAVVNVKIKPELGK